MLVLAVPFMVSQAVRRKMIVAAASQIAIDANTFMMPAGRWIRCMLGFSV